MVLFCGPTINKTYLASVKLSTKLYQKYRANYKCPLYIDEVRVSEQPKPKYLPIDWKFGIMDLKEKQFELWIFIE